MGIGKKKVVNKRPELKEIFAVLALLEQNDMNKSVTARQAGISRTSLIRYEKKYWEEYLREKSIVRVETLNEQAEVIKLDYELEKARGKINASFEKALALMNERLDDEESRKKISTKDLVMYISNLAPFLADKLGAAGLKKDEDGIQNNHNTFIQNFIREVKFHNNTNNNVKKSD